MGHSLWCAMLSQSFELSPVISRKEMQVEGRNWRPSICSTKVTMTTIVITKSFWLLTVPVSIFREKEIQVEYTIQMGTKNQRPRWQLWRIQGKGEEPLTDTLSGDMCIPLGASRLYLTPPNMEGTVLCPQQWNIPVLQWICLPWIQGFW